MRKYRFSGCGREKKHIKRIPAVLLAAALLVSALLLTGCYKYPSRYRALGFVHSNTADSANMSFYEFTGTMSFKLKCGADQKLKYYATLETGSAKVYIDCGSGKTELFSVNTGEEAYSLVDLPRAGTVYIIIETDGACNNGSFEFEIK